MNNELLKILAESNSKIDNQKLLDYLNNKLSGEEKHEIERSMVDSKMLNDAVEGLEEFENKKDLTSYTSQLNADLYKQLKTKYKRKPLRRLKDQSVFYAAVIIILLLIILAFVIIRYAL